MIVHNNARLRAFSNGSFVNRDILLRISKFFYWVPLNQTLCVIRTLWSTKEEEIEVYKEQEEQKRESRKHLRLV
jgi:hypothetical protein